MEFKFASKESSLRFVEIKFLSKESSLRFVEFKFAFGGIQVCVWWNQVSFHGIKFAFCDKFAFHVFIVKNQVFENACELHRTR